MAVGMTADDAPSVSWRQRVRDSATRDILRTARQVLAEGGVAELTVRAVARQLGMSSQALYRYFDSHEGMVDAVTLDVVDEVEVLLATTAETGADAATEKVVLLSRALRRWVIDHPHEFELTMVTPKKSDNEDLKDARYRFGRVFTRVLAQHWDECGRPDWPTHGVPPGLTVAVREFRRGIELPIPDEIVAVCVRCWIRLYGVICMEAMGHLDFLATESDCCFEAELVDLANWIGPPTR